MKNKYAVGLGRIKSEAKAKSSRENGKLGGRPKKVLSEDLDSFGIPLEEMARISPDDSGLPVTVVILVGEGLPHGPRIKVSGLYGGKVREDSLVQVTIEDVPQFIGKNSSLLSSSIKKKIVLFIIKNKKILIDHYYGRVTDKQALNGIVSV